MAKIHILDEHIANQIAAGEVVERPASVVKELVENSIDAGATRIEVHVAEGGLESIRVTDNGSGIEPDDCETAFYRHATSKIENSRDLFHITSLGFRGEALPSIAAVAKVDLTTSSRDDGLGRRIRMEGGKLLAVEETPAPRGTDIVVRELFFNTPARLKYMKTIQTELGHISDFMYRIALSHPDIAITLRHNENQLIKTLGNGDLLQVIAAVYGRQAAKAMLPIRAESLDFELGGYVSLPEWTRSNRNGVSTIVNGRYIRNYGLNQAIQRAYHTLLPINRYPLAVLEIKMHPSLVDVNVHPAKLEVRFSKEQELYPFVEESIHKVLRQEVLIPQAVKQNIGGKNSGSFIQEQLHFPHRSAAESNANAGEAAAAEEAVVQSPAGSDNVSAASTTPPSGDSSGAVQSSRQESIGSLSSSGIPFQSQQAPAQGIVREERPAYRDSGEPLRYSSQGSNPELARRLLETSADSSPEIPPFPELTLIGQHHGTYLIAQNDQGLYLIDQHAAHERVNYEFYYEKFGQPADASQELLLPITLEFTPSETEQLKDKLQWFEQAGVYLEHFGGQTFRVRSHPYWFPKGEEKEIIEEMAEWVLSERVIDLAKLREKSSILCSCKASIKANQKLTEQEANTLLDRLGACRQPYTCPHGRPIVISFSTYDLEKLFKRVM
ncbi:DNA mismatch repair endonuclease MutL [Paenibacillus donghaensis]|uniref:DNA mismatch repair endonuclease MutL n=1 Tax=Paenibacillus donghaensis TaxID=414771 RepID=UPI001883E152|nr:DNA mismatch repair endonuclease MutL [Paenibacillus donghaensis]MBE9915774.1 DNA mismatch repair endonuclease MutL [Paenibacillus donghaensis]